MTFTLMGEEFNIRTDHIKNVERFGNSVKISYEDGSSEVWRANYPIQINKINILEIILRGIFAGYNQAKNELYEDGGVDI